MALTKVSTPGIKDEAITLAKLLHGDSNSNGKFLRANNGADPSYETIDLTALSASNLTSGTLPDARFPATLPAISGANLTNLPVQASISSQGSNRLITSGGGSSLIGQQHLTFDGAHLILGSGKGIRTNYIRPTDGSNTNTGGASQQYWKIGDISLNGSEAAVITLMGANGYSSGGSNFAAETTIVLRGGNANTLLGFWYSDAGVGIGTYSDVRWKYTSGTTYELWVSAGPFNNVAPIVKTTGTFDNTNAAGTNSNTAPTGSTALPSNHVKKVGSIDTIEYQSTGTIFKRNVVMDNGYGIDFSATGGPTNGTDTSELFKDYEEGTWSPQIYYQNSTNQSNSTNLASYGWYQKVGNVVHLGFFLRWTLTGSAANDNIGVKNMPFAISSVTSTYGSAGAIGSLSHSGTDLNQNSALVLKGQNNGGTLMYMEDIGSNGNRGDNFGANTGMRVWGSFTYRTT